MDVRVEGLADALKRSVENICKGASVKGYMGEDKIVLVVSANDVKARIAAKQEVKKRKPSPLTEEERGKVKEIRRVLKGSMDAMYVVTLILRVREEFRKLSLKALEPMKLQVVKRAVQELEKEFKGKLLEVTSGKTKK